MEACLIVTYRCNAKCYMCNTWQSPSKISEEYSPELVEKIPDGLNFINITGGEPFLRDDLEDIIKIAVKKSNRVVISSNGYFTKKIVRMAKKFGNKIGFRISIEGLPAANDELRGLKDGFDHGLRTLVTLHSMGIKDIGFGMTVSDRNAKDMIELYRLANAMGVEFATATTHNSYYFHKDDNSFLNPNLISNEFEKIAVELLKTNKPKNWFRAYFNMGLANKVTGGKRPLPCEVGTEVFFLDPFGNIVPCNGSDAPMIMGNLHQQSFDDIWTSKQAETIRQLVKNCDKQCWMIGSASPAMKKKISVPALWVMKNKLKVMKSKGENICLDPVGK
ncbi:Fe-S oxidoreductase (radical SAM family protein) [Desulforapulum autotrophicum HRM2]|uniref:Fe-S oxidoreductase (Radical SAM family protein) n=1 Tax=Desulforapulum autotrophicum (strain ATCC 43914 / DSM 3382 / VKM B-1955 / HRM2) TaxID=177437 RepID=C0QGY2_DESAH|nr:radical SAM protein [Desulforapulum autotrophicum]ACN15631.1 Fe-S oxidoreductase (radical SAM family protein) [Desulforapulum autotrophicum HRM2]